MHWAYEWITSWPALATYAGAGLAYLLIESIGLLIRWRCREADEDRRADPLHEFQCAKCGAKKHTCRLRPRPEQVCLDCWSANYRHRKAEQARVALGQILQALGLTASRYSDSEAQRVASAPRPLNDVHYGSSGGNPGINWHARYDRSGDDASGAQENAIRSLEGD
jgi:hypothetical protein